MTRDLFLVLKKEAFVVMVTGQKNIEVRRPSKWIHRRLEGRHYDTATFQCGYAKGAPRFTCIYRGYEVARASGDFHWPGLSVNMSPGDYVIYLGKILTKMPAR